LSGKVAPAGGTLDQGTPGGQLWISQDAGSGECAAKGNVQAFRQEGWLELGKCQG
jgi:hypothetical protein